MVFTLDVLLKWLGWCAMINIGILTLWFVAFASMRDWIFRIHSRWFTLTQADFDAIHYAAMARFKLLVLVVNIVPYLALRNRYLISLNQFSVVFYRVISQQHN